MALIDCYECKNRLSTKAFACPHCGAPTQVASPVDILGSVLRDAHALAPAGGSSHVASTLARGYFLIGFLIAATLYTTRGIESLGVYLAQFLLLGFGVGLVAFGYAREPKDTLAAGGVIGGWMYTLLVGSAILSANIAHLTG